MVLCAALSVLCLLAFLRPATSAPPCTDFTDCHTCTQHKGWSGSNCTYCEMPSAVGNYVCHDPFDITNPCLFYCPDDDVHTPSKCHVAPPNVYDPVMAETLLYLSASSYSPIPGQCLSNLPNLKAKNWMLYKVFSSSYCDGANSTCFGYAAFSLSSQAIVLGFRGTVTVTQLLFEAIQAFFPTTAWPSGGAVNGYFKEASDSMWPDVKTAIEELSTKYPQFKVYVTGHSLGGAIASLTASALVEAKILRSSPILYTFGAPRVGNHQFAQIFDMQIPNAWRIIHYIDPFPHMPLCEYIEVNGPIPVCNPCNNPNLFSYHTGTEVWYNITTPNFKPTDSHFVCMEGWPYNEALNCSAGQAGIGVDCFKNINNCLADHSFYFGVSVSACGISNCTDMAACA